MSSLPRALITQSKTDG